MWNNPFELVAMARIECQIHENDMKAREELLNNFEDSQLDAMIADLEAQDARNDAKEAEMWTRLEQLETV